MMYIITNYICIGGVWFNSEPMEYEKAVKEYNVIEKQAMRGLCDFPDLIDENGNIIM